MAINALRRTSSTGLVHICYRSVPFMRQVGGHWVAVGCRHWVIGGVAASLASVGRLNWAFAPVIRRLRRAIFVRDQSCSRYFAKSYHVDCTARKNDKTLGWVNVQYIIGAAGWGRPPRFSGRKVRTPQGRKSCCKAGYRGPYAAGRKVPQKKYRPATQLSASPSDPTQTRIAE